MNSFQTIILGIFGFFIIAGLLTVALVKQKGGPDVVSLSIWGSVPQAAVADVLRSTFTSETLKVSYRAVPEESLDQTLLEALAAGRGPDMVLLPLELLSRYKDKLQLIPYGTYTERTFKDSFIQEGDLFLFPKGIIALPFYLDPLVMYFNRDLLDEAGVAVPPKYWDEFISLAKKLTVRDEDGNISRSAVALGEFRNVQYAKEILATMFLQSGNPIITTDSSGTHATLGQTGISSILDFYTEFANPRKPDYSWNRALPNSKNLFLSSRLGVYFGLGSEYNELRKGNPNLDFDVALFPRPRNQSVGIVYGKLTGVSVLRTSRNLSSALQVAYTLTAPKVGSLLRSKTGLPPVQRSLLTAKPTDAYGAIMYDSATRARGFLDPNPKASTEIFRNMIEGMTSGKTRGSEAALKAQTELNGAMR